MSKSLKQIQLELEEIADGLFYEVQGESKLGNQIADLSSEIKKHIDTLNKMTEL